VKPGSVTVERTYPYSRDHVWRALTEPELLARWLMPNDFVAEVGHRFTFRTEPGPGFDGVVHCEVLELEPPSRLVLSWKGGPLDTTVTFSLTESTSDSTSRSDSESTDATLLRVHHTGFRGLKARLVARILAIGNRSIYGRRLPEVLADIAQREDAAPPTPPEACMERKQGFLLGILHLMPWSKK